jgi:hypothetical protein
MVTEDEVRCLALALPEAAEADHHGFPSFRVRGKIFATLRDPGFVNVMIAVEEVEAVVAEDPECCAPLWWGKKLSGVRVDLARVEAALLTELLTDSWRRRAPKALLD